MREGQRTRAEGGTGFLEASSMDMTADLGICLANNRKQHTREDGLNFLIITVSKSLLILKATPIYTPAPMTLFSPTS